MNVVKIHPERLIESAVCRDDTQVLVENQQWIADRIHDGLGERAGIVEVYEQRAIGQGQRVSRPEAFSIV
jgi:hypothetical protein